MGIGLRNLNGPEYEARLRKPFIPPTVSLKDVHAAVPKKLLQKDPLKATSYILRDIALSALLFKCGSCINPWAESAFGGNLNPGWQVWLVKNSLWTTYWWIQSLVWAGFFCLGHDAGHGSLFNSPILNNAVGFVLHTTLLIPYFAWRATHHGHHKATSSIERDESYVPYTRSDYKLPPKEQARKFDYAEVFEETPIYTLSKMLIMQGFGWWMYLTQNTMGSKAYPPGTNHFNPNSPLFKPSQRNAIIVTNIGLGCMVGILCWLGPGFVARYYLVPYLLTNHWIVMLTYLQHSDPTIPHYRKNEWTFLRGAAATVDRPLLGWMGRFFLHNVGHDHVAHHFFISAPFFNGPEITKAIKPVLKDDYNYDSTPSFYALWRSFTQCLFIEEDEDIAFYKNRQGESLRVVDEEYKKNKPVN
ncbi:Fatty acid desaturase [Pleurotus pulmonarius]